MTKIFYHENFFTPGYLEFIYGARNEWTANWVFDWNEVDQRLWYTNFHWDAEYGWHIGLGYGGGEIVHDVYECMVATRIKTERAEAEEMLIDLLIKQKFPKYQTFTRNHEFGKWKHAPCNARGVNIGR